MTALTSIAANREGFSLPDLLVAVAVAAIVTSAIFMAHRCQSRSYAAQERVAAMRQNMRTAVYHLEKDLRMAGYDPTGRAAGAGVLSVAGNRFGDSVAFSMDVNDDSGRARPDGDTDDANEEVRYSLNDDDGDGDLDLEKNGWLVAENVEALAFAYAYDDDGDGEAEWTDKNGNGRLDAGEIIWSVDSDGDNELDADLDANGDGTIDEEDDRADGEQDGHIAGVPLPGGARVGVKRIRAVRFWILVRAERATEGYLDTAGTSGGRPPYVAGRWVIRPSRLPGAADNRYMRRMATGTVACRNLGQ
jgi:type II secretory pathway pseudopilin PulG